MAVKEKQGESEEIDWNVENEVQLFFAMNGHKPVGVNKHFHMVCIWEKFRAAINKEVSLKAIWDHLENMYDLVALDDTEELPFPSTETDFSLPEAEFQDLIKKKEEPDLKPREQKEKAKEMTKKEKETKETPKKEVVTRESSQKTPKEVEKKKEEVKKVAKEPEVRREKSKETKEVRKDNRTPKGRGKGKEESEDALTALPTKKERKDSDSSRETPKRVPKRPTRQSIDNASKASSSPRDTPPPKRRRI